MVDSVTVLIVTVVLALLISGAAFILLNNGTLGSSTQGKPTILLVGPQGGGKTSLFKKWALDKSSGESLSIVGGGKDEDQIRVVPSQSINRYEHLKLPLGSDPLNEEYSLVDIPGHSRLGYLVAKELEATRNNLVCVVFVVDAAGGPKSVKDAASSLYELLKLTEKRSNGVDILIAANKFDVFNVLSTHRLQTMLEAEINELRASQSKSIGQVSSKDDADIDESVWIGGTGEFKFTQLEGQVSTIEGSVLAGKTSRWEDWINETALNK